MKAIAHGHSTIELRGHQYRILIDPFFTEAQQFEAVGSLDYILLTHAHGDHMTGALDLAKKNQAKIVAIYELCAHMENQGAQVEPLGIGGTLDLGDTKITMVPALHSSSIFHQEPFSVEYMGAPVGFIVEMDGRRIYHAGDTAIFSDMKLWGELYPLDAAILPIGGTYTMDMRQAVKAAELLNVSQVIPIHYNTFPAIALDVQDFAAMLQESGRLARILKPGEAFVF
jgi:L-ascorbate metabolism protein UlaG (beta-lactamase superfamily)